MTLDIAICDDERDCIDNLLSCLAEYKWKTDKRIDTFKSPDKLLQSAQKNKYDIIFLDIQLEGGPLGTDVGSRIKKINPKTLLIYVSSYNFYVKIANAEPFAFISKPIDKIFLFDIVDKAINRIIFEKSENFYMIKTKMKDYNIDLKDVIFFESDHRVINCTMENEIIPFYGKLDEIEEEITYSCAYFARPNKSYLINCNYIENVSYPEIKIRGKGIIRISSRYKKAFTGTWKECRFAL